MDEEADDILEIEEVAAVEPTPWYNSDTVATSMLFASQLAQAAADHFQNLAQLALGQSAHEWVQKDREEFIEDSILTINNLPEGGEVSG